MTVFKKKKHRAWLKRFKTASGCKFLYEDESGNKAYKPLRDGNHRPTPEPSRQVDRRNALADSEDEACTRTHDQIKFS